MLTRIIRQTYRSGATARRNGLALKIIGLSLMASPEFNNPLFHHAYLGKKCDSKQFVDIIDKLN
jgi:transposase